MNSLYTLGVRQTNSLQSDLERLRNGDNSASLLGQISASLSAMHRTVDDYDSMAKREIIKAKQEKAQMRVQKFRTDYADLRNQFDLLKKEADAQTASAQRSELLSTTAIPLTPSTSSTRQRFSQFPPSSSSTPEYSESPFRTPTPQPNPNAYNAYASMSREDHALHEHSFIQSTEARLDDFLAQGREVLDNLVDQRNVLKGTQRMLLDSANTLGLSRDVIGWIERRSKQDMYIFFAGAIFTFFCFYLIWKYLG
ncbi:hypothetical protein PILCRDRAFT_572726 [Piloderma croceum F 1598]|uniref:Protein transport protein BOS1 n=1 Tax=Piloderma croceum (strain F 1598) TaxID=765440 RepID=A0A0C3BNS3_PILCF|nr:hypothetical protein PILCRDRAFT_572726 [Piloderma croceum F 1598]